MLGKYQFSKPYLLVYEAGVFESDVMIQEFETQLQMEIFIVENGISEGDVFVCCKVDKHLSVNILQ